jgi:hypothetical protein
LPILADRLTAERIVMLFSSSASKKWREDAAMIMLCGSMAEYSASPQAIGTLGKSTRP